MGGGVGFDDDDKAGDNDVERCRSGFVDWVGIGALITGVVVAVFSLLFLVETLGFEGSSVGACTGTGFWLDCCTFPLTFPLFSLDVSLLPIETFPLPNGKMNKLNSLYSHITYYT